MAKENKDNEKFEATIDEIIHYADALTFHKPKEEFDLKGNLIQVEKEMPSRLMNYGLSAPLYIRQETIHKIKDLIKNDLIQTCELRKGGIFQQYAVMGKCDDKD